MKQPPKLFLRFFKWFCDPDLHPFIEGDLLELYGERLAESGQKKADRRFALDVLLLFRPGIIRSFKWMDGLHNQLFMLANYFKLFRRNFKRQPTFNLLNLLCLAIGIAAVAGIALYLDFETSYDQQHVQADRIYRLNTSAIRTREKIIDVDWQGAPAPLGPLALQDCPEVASFVRFFSFFSNDIRFGYEEEDRIEVIPEEVIAVDSNVFEVFSFDLIQGDPETALKGPNRVVISETLADRIFGDRDPIGALLTTHLAHRFTGEGQDYALEVSGVFRDLPYNTHLFFQAMISAETDPELGQYYFGNFHTYTYLLLREQAVLEDLSPKLTAIYDHYINPEVEPVLVNATHQLMPLKDIHFSETGGTTYLYIFGGIGLLVLLIAFIGYLNLVTAQAGRRAMEIGLRKVLGSGRRQLILQFLAESTFMTLLGLSIAVLILALAIKPLNVAIGLHLEWTQLFQVRMLAIVSGLILLLGLIGGSYPAFFLSSFRPLQVIKGERMRSAPLQKWLLAFQFAVVLFVLSSTGMIYRQLRFMQEKDLGFARDRIVQLRLPERQTSSEMGVLKERLQSSSGINSIAAGNFNPGIGGMINRPASVEASEPQFIRVGHIDYDFLETMEIDLLAGRNFSPDFPADTTQHVLINETFARRFELGDQALGARVRYGDWGNPQTLRVIGIVEDVHQSSLHAAIEPQLFRLGPTSGHLLAKIGPDTEPVIRHMEQVWKEHFPDQPLQYSFLNDDLQARYELDQRRGSLFLLFSAITVLIAFAGLYGLAAYLTGRRQREIAIRKVLGANFYGIVQLLTRDFVVLVFLAALPALVLAWYTIRQWLEAFAFRIPVQPAVFVLALLSVLLLVLLTVGRHAGRAAVRNPGEVLE